MTEEQNIKKLTLGKTAEEALEVLNEVLKKDSDNAALLIERGKLFWRLNRRGDALSDYEKAAQIAPESPASLLLEHSYSIMSFFNPDILNP